MEKGDTAGLSSATPSAPTDFASAHAQLLLIGEAIRTAVAELSIPQTPQPQAPLPPKSQASPSTVSLPSSPASHNANGPLLTPPPAVNEAAGMASATDRLAALHDHLRRVQTLMKEYEAVSQRAVEMHLLPSTEAEAGDNDNSSGGEHAGHGDAGQEKQPPHQPQTKLAALPPSPTRRGNSQAGQTRPGAEKPPSNFDAKKGSIPIAQNAHSNVFNSNNNTNPISKKNHNGTNSNRSAGSNGATGPSLHQRRALASDATFTRFCGLRVDPEHLLLPWSTQGSSNNSGTSPFAPPGMAAAAAAAGGAGSSPTTFRPTLDKEELTLNAAILRPPSSSSIASHSSTASSHSMASTTLRLAQQQRQQQAATAHLTAYARFFLHPQSPFSLSPAFPAHAPAAAVEAYLASPAAAADPVNGPSVLLRQLKDTQSQFEALRRCRLFTYEARLREMKAAAEAAPPEQGGASASSAATAATKSTAGPAVKQLAGSAAGASAAEEPKWEHTSVLVERMCDVLSALRTRFVVDSRYAYCGTPAVTLGRQLHAWTQPLLRQLNEILSNPTLEDVDQDLRENLRRMRFDVEELQQEQAEAIANGDMQRSEELYHEQTALSEAMNAPYDEMEQLLTEYLEECVTAPLAALQEQRDTLTERLARVIEEHTTKLTEVTQDIDRVKEKRRNVIQSRHRQRNAMSSYQHSWKKQWQGNSEAQMACYRAMEQLENRLSSLQKAQGILAEDWLTHMALERQREEDAAAFTCFAEARTQALTEAQRNLQSVVDGLRQLSGAIHFSCSHAEAFAREVLQGHVTDTQLAVRKDRLAQFRALYLTLGDWRFKKSRNAEEMQKKIEYYTLQQEVAMDVSNPKAREYSQAKQQWEAAKAEALAQLDQLDDRSRLQLEAFRPTEHLLRQAGVDFVSPEEELAQRNMQRTQRLVEYQQLIEEGIGVRGAASNTRGDGAIVKMSATTSGRLPALQPGGAMATAAAMSCTTPARAYPSDRPYSSPSSHCPSPPPPAGAPQSKQSPSLLKRTTPHTGGLVGTGTATSASTVTPTATATAAAAPPAGDVSYGGGVGGAGNAAGADTAAALPPVNRSSRSASGTSASLPPIAAKNAAPPRLHSTEERIMHDISKTAGASAAAGGGGKAQKRKSTK